MKVKAKRRQEDGDREVRGREKSARSGNHEKKGKRKRREKKTK